MRLYHRTWSRNAKLIIEGGFGNAVDDIIWFSTVPLEPCQLKCGHPDEVGDVVLAVDIPPEVAETWEKEDRNGYRAYKAQAEQVNFCRSPMVFCTDYVNRSLSELRQIIESGDESKRPWGRSDERLREFIDLMENVPLQ